MKDQPTIRIQIERLPKWAQEHICSLQRQRDEAVRCLNERLEAQPKTSIYVEDYLCLGENPGPSTKRTYVQGNAITVEHAGVELNIHLSRRDDSQRDYGIELSWGSVNSHHSHVAMLPSSFQQVQLVAKENMR